MFPERADAGDGWTRRSCIRTGVSQSRWCSSWETEKSGDVTFTKRKSPGKGCKNKAVKKKIWSKKDLSASLGRVLVIKGYQRSRKQKGCGQTSEIHTLQKGRSRRRWNCWRIFAAFLKTFETKFSHCLFWRRIWSWKSLEASRHSCCHREALHRRNDSSAVFQSQRSDIWAEKNCSEVGR